MKKQLCTIVALIPMLSAPMLAQSFNITSLGRNGSLTWTNAFTNGVYSVQWASGLGANTQWQETWDYLKTVVGKSNTVTASVPMFYRVRCVTNLFVPMPVGRVWTFVVSDALANTWTLQVSYPSILPVPALTNDYVMHADTDSTYGKSMDFRRSTENARYVLQGFDSEILLETNGPVGTTWTSVTSGNVTNTTTIISTNATVVVAAGTFSNCLCFSNRFNGTYGLDYVKPGLGVVKQVNFAAQPNPPWAYQLQSVTDQ